MIITNSVAEEAEVPPEEAEEEAEEDARPTRHVPVTKRECRFCFLAKHELTKYIGRAVLARSLLHKPRSFDMGQYFVFLAKRLGHRTYEEIRGPALKFCGDMEESMSGAILAMLLVTASGMGRGCGDFRVDLAKELYPSMWALIKPYMGRWCKAKLMLVGDYSDEYDRIPKTKYIGGDEAAVAYLCMEYITAVANAETNPMVQVHQVAGKLYMENKKAVLARVTDLATQDQPNDIVACQQNDIEEEGCEKKTKKMKTQPA